jgi:hypothetical protein
MLRKMISKGRLFAHSWLPVEQHSLAKDNFTSTARDVARRLAQEPIKSNPPQPVAAGHSQAQCPAFFNQQTTAAAGKHSWAQDNFTTQIIDEALRVARETVLREMPDYFDLPPLHQHVAAFGWQTQGQVFFNGKTTAAVVKQHGLPGIVGHAIAAGSNLHAHRCIFSDAPFDPFLAAHLGSSRIYTKEGAIDEARLKLILEQCTVNGEINELTWHAAIDALVKTDPQEPDSGRNTQAFPSNEALLRATSKAESRAMFKALVHRYGPNGERIVYAILVEAFFRDTKSTLLAAKSLGLPYPVTQATPLIEDPKPTGNGPKG